MKHLIALLLLIICQVSCDESAPRANVPTSQQLLTSYFSNEEMKQFMLDLTNDKCRNISRLFSIGKSVEGEELWVLEISSSPGKVEPKPNFKYVANMHGDETSGRQLLLKLADWLCENRGIDKEVDRIIDGMHLFLMPSMNPDGFAALTRNNKGNVDLNRDFPDRFREGAGYMTPSGKEAPETAAVMKWIQDGFFVASANLHEGAVVANYPWDADKNSSSKYAASPDDSTFVYLAKIYANAHTTMHEIEEFANGITNGNAWYPVYGSMQDYNYIVGDCLELTLELNQDKNPPAEQLRRLWGENKKAFVQYMLASTFGGFRGLVLGRNKNPLSAEIKVNGLSKVSNTRAIFGDFYRPLSPGEYTVTIKANGYFSQTMNITIPEDGSGVKKVFRLRLRGDDTPRDLRTVRASGANISTLQPNWMLDICILTVGVMFVTYALQRMRTRATRKPLR